MAATGVSHLLDVRDAPAPTTLADNPLTFLTSLGGPVAWRVPGRDRRRVRVVTTLLHGNEPSGFLALHAWLRSGIQPAVDALCVIANVEAAALHPVFTHRSLPRQRDLNRSFHGPFDDATGRVAGSLLELIEASRAEALVDLHNNTGRNPAYGVGIQPTPERLQLTALFGRDFVWSRLALGALLEAVDTCPAVTIEVGKSGDDAADAVALDGVTRFFGADRLFSGALPPVRVLEMPMRARVRQGCSLVMAQQPTGSADLTMPDDLDRHNFQTVPAGSRIGWTRDGACPLGLFDAEGRDRAADYFEVRGNELIAHRPFMPIMITADAQIAMSDCLFYIVHEVS